MARLPPPWLDRIVPRARRRGLLRAAGVYAVLSWFLVQLLATFSQILGLPDWTVRAAVALSFAGLPVAIGVAWVFGGPSVSRRQRPSPRGEPVPRRADGPSGGDVDRGPETGPRLRRPPFRLPRLETVLLVALALVGAALWAYRGRRPRGPAAGGDAAPTSVAVLPFVNVTGDPDQEYFSQGVSDEIRTALARVPGLQIASRTSTFRSAEGGKDVREIARELDVASILEGSVQRAQDRVHVSVSLVDARSDRQLWTQTFDRQLDMESLFQVEAEIATSVATALQVKLDALAGHLTGPVPTSVAAHDLYLLGLYHWNRRTGDELLQAAEFFREAATRDPDYALAQAGLANTYVLLPLYAHVPAAEAMPRARAAAEAALALDSTLAEARAALAFVRTTYDWDWQGAEADFVQALSLNPRYATAHEWYGVLLDARGRFDEALTQHERAQSLDPLSVIINAVLGYHLVFVGAYDRAVTQLLHTLQLQTDLPLALQFLAETYLLSGRNLDAQEALTRMAEATNTDPDAWVRVIRGTTSPDARPDALAAVRTLAAEGSIEAYNQAQYYAFLGADDEALGALERGLQSRDFLMFFVDVDPAFDSLHDRPRFRAILTTMGLAAPSAGESSPGGSAPRDWE